MPPKSQLVPVHRPSVSEIALALANRRTEPTQNVTLTRNAKGEVQIIVDVTGENIAACGKLAEAEYKRLDRLFPLSAAQKQGQVPV